MKITELGKKLFGNDIRVEKTVSGWQVSILQSDSFDPDRGTNANHQYTYRIGKNPLEVKALVDMGIISLR